MDTRKLIDVDATAAFSLPAPPAATPAAPTPDERPAWVEEARASLDTPGRYVAYEDGGRRVVVPMAGELTRIGRSLSAHLRFDDATVSRRHAVIAAGADGVRVLDDRSLNGIYVNGARVDAAFLHDGDVIGIGRHALWFLDNARVGVAEAAEPAFAAD